MRIGCFRRFFIALLLGAFLCAGIGAPMPTADAAPMAGSAMTMTMEGGTTMPMPCKGKGMGPNCYASMGCIVMVALPPAYTPATAQLTWSRVVYLSGTSPQTGLVLEPDLGPPIHA